MSVVLLNVSARLVCDHVEEEVRAPAEGLVMCKGGSVPAKQDQSNGVDE
jgi:hypothetical protein